MNINSAGSTSLSMIYGGAKRPDPAKIAEDLYSKLDTKGQGYIEKSDLQTAFDKISSTGSTNTDDLFSQLDGDSDGKVTKAEMSASFEKIAAQLDGPFPRMRLQGQGDSSAEQGFTKDELTGLAQDTNSTDSKASSLFAGLAENFDAVDSNQDGRVNQAETEAYIKASGSAETVQPAQGGTPPPREAGLQAASSSTSYDPADTNKDGSVSEAEALAYETAKAAASATKGAAASEDQGSSEKVMKQIMQLVQAYGSLGTGSEPSSLSVSV
ncbi:MAG: EF-hand domain-containing protein [Methylovulum sp.]|nr:EF-hand domain-containing protein [Methylovulum sp.]